MQTRPGFWILLSAAVIGIVTTTLAWEAASSGSTEGRRRLGEWLLTPAWLMLPGLHDVVSMGFALFMNALAIGAVAWGVLTFLWNLFHFFRHTGLRSS